MAAVIFISACLHALHHITMVWQKGQSAIKERISLKTSSTELKCMKCLFTLVNNACM